jgi:hypothetical protein
MGRTRGTRSTQSKGQNKAPTLRHGTRHEQEEHEAHTPPRWSPGSRPGRMVHRRRRPEGRAVGRSRMPKQQKEALVTVGEQTASRWR